MASNSWANDWLTGDVPSAAEYRKSMGCVFDSTLGVAASTIVASSLPTTYAHMRAMLFLRGDNASTTVGLSVRMNADSGANYNYQQILANNATVTASAAVAATSASLPPFPAANAPAFIYTAITLDLLNYGNSIRFKTFLATGWMETADTAAGQFAQTNGGVWKATAAINSLTFISAAGNFDAGSRVSVYVMGS